MKDKAKNLKMDLYNISATTGLGTLVVYYSKKGKIKRFPTSVKCHPNNWDKKNREVLKGGISAEERAIVETLYNKINKIITDYQFKYNDLPSVEHISQQTQKPEEAENIHTLYKEFVEDHAKTLSYTKKSAFKVLGELLLAVDKKHKYHLNLHNLNYTFIQKFKTYCLDVKKNQNSTINLRITDLITFVNWINRKEIKHTIKSELWQKLDDNSVQDFTCLERDELNAILSYDVKKEHKDDDQEEMERMQQTKDIIVFLSHTGMRVGDMELINKHNIIDGCINFTPSKTKRKKIQAIIPITKQVREILERYDYKLSLIPMRSINRCIRRFCSNIKELQKKIVNKKVVDNEEVTEVVPKYSILDSHAIGRKTFINLCIERKVQLTTIAGCTGHSKIDTIIEFYADKHANKQTALSEVFEM